LLTISLSAWDLGRTLGATTSQEVAGELATSEAPSVDQANGLSEDSRLLQKVATLEKNRTELQEQLKQLRAVVLALRKSNPGTQTQPQPPGGATGDATSVKVKELEGKIEALTKQLNELPKREEIATKKDLENLATKKDLEKVKNLTEPP